MLLGLCVKSCLGLPLIIRLVRVYPEPMEKAKHIAGYFAFDKVCRVLISLLEYYYSAVFPEADHYPVRKTLIETRAMSDEP